MNMIQDKDKMIQQSTTREIFTRAQAAEYLGVTKRYLDMQAMHGTDLPMYRLGRLVRYRKSDLDKWLESKRVINKGENNGYCIWMGTNRRI